MVLVVAVVMWNRPEPVPTSDEEEEAFEAEHDIPVRTDGGRTLASWGMGLAILVGVIAFSTILLSYFYLRARPRLATARRARPGTDPRRCQFGAGRRQRHRHAPARRSIRVARRPASAPD